MWPVLVDFEFVAFPPLATAPDPCRLVTAAEISSAIGGKPAPGRPFGPSRDDEVGAGVTARTIPSGTLTRAISVADFATLNAARKAVARPAEPKDDDPDVIRLSPVDGPGDAAFWGANHLGAIWVVLVGKRLLNLTLSGEVGDGARFRDRLKALVAAALPRL